MRARGFSSCVISSESRSALVAWWSASSGDEPVADSTEMWVEPSWVLFRSRAVLAAVSFSKVTVADLVSPSALTSRLVILPLDEALGCQQGAPGKDSYLPEAEEVADLLVVRFTGDVLYVNSCGRHDERVLGVDSGVKTAKGRGRCVADACLLEDETQ